MSDAGIFGAAVWVIAIVVLIVAIRRKRGRSRSVGSGAAGAVYGLLNEDKRRAIEIIVEKRAEACDPEDRDGNLPDLEHPGSHP